MTATIEAEGDLHGRAIPEWIGKTPDTPVPDHVMVRIFLRQKRRCALTGRRFLPGEVLVADHKIRLKDGGHNRESNIQIVLEKPHREKTAEENSQGAHELRLQKKLYCRKPKGKGWPKSRGFGWGRGA